MPGFEPGNLGLQWTCKRIKYSLHSRPESLSARLLFALQACTLKSVRLSESVEGAAGIEPTVSR
jgi:hypothetical protein